VLVVTDERADKQGAWSWLVGEVDVGCVLALVPCTQAGTDGPTDETEVGGGECAWRV
jgi:hypothetical protein